MTSDTSDLPAIGTPARRSLATIGVTRLDQLNDFTQAEIADLHGVGPKALRILVEALARSGLEFGSRR